jgi:hypothetical protein
MPNAGYVALYGDLTSFRAAARVNLCFWVAWPPTPGDRVAPITNAEPKKPPLRDRLRAGPEALPSPQYARNAICQWPRRT